MGEPFAELHGPWSDAARRLSDRVSEVIADLGPFAYRMWIAPRLSDGGTDGVVYESKADAIEHQLHETQCAYVQIVPGGMPARDAEVFLDVHRRLYDQGARIVDPDRDIHIPWQLGDVVLRRRMLARNLGGNMNRAERRAFARRNLKRGRG